MKRCFAIIQSFVRLKPINMQSKISLIIPFVLLILPSTFGAISKSDMAEIFNSVRDICSSKISIPEQVFLDVAEGRPDDNNVDLKCFALCIAKTLGFIKRSGEFDVMKFRNLTVKLVLTDGDNKEEFENAIEECKDIQLSYEDACDKSYFFIKCITQKNPSLFVI